MNKLFSLALEKLYATSLSILTLLCIHLLLLLISLFIFFFFYPKEILPRSALN